MLATHFIMGDPGKFWLISMITRARYLKFVGAIVQRLFLVMVKISCQHNEVGFIMECRKLLYALKFAG